MNDKGWFSTNTITITKTKNLLGCRERTGYKTAVQSVPYTAESVSTSNDGGGGMRKETYTHVIYPT